MKKITVAILVSLWSSMLCAQVPADTSIIALHQTLKRHLTGGVAYLHATQRLETEPGHSYRGEWQAFMSLRRTFFYLGVKKDVDDSNCFAVASIHNALARIHLSFPEYEEIPGMLDLSFQKVMSYRNGDKFNFWNLLPPTRKLKKNDIVGQQPLVRRPTNYMLRSKFINKAANIVEDADDTSLAYTAIALRRMYKTDVMGPEGLGPASIAPIFDQYRDVGRSNRHWYNYIAGNDHETGAYLTWLADEYSFKRWNVLKSIGNNLGFFLPWSIGYPRAYTPYLPYNTNDLDGVVNANVLSALAYHDELDADGVDCAVAYIERKCSRKKFDRVATYYPNRYHFPYAVSKAFACGVDQLQASSDLLATYLVQSQNKNGSWSARRILNKKDKLQSTAYALNALVNIGDYEARETTASIEKAISYLLASTIHDTQGVHWEGGVFFSGGTVVRNVLWWKSDAYTTAIILDAFANYRKYLEDKYDLVQLNN